MGRHVQALREGPHDELDLKYVKVTAIAVKGIQIFKLAG